MVKTFITTVVAHIDHGKTTLIDSLISATGHISKTVAGEIRYLDTRSDEQTRGITLKLSAIELFYKHKYIIIDTPGHVDFESLVEISSRLSDSFILIVDINEGITPRLFSIAKFITKNTILVINKIDKQLNKSVDEIHSLLVSVIIRVNSLVKEELFSWDRNNVIIAWSTMCVGVSKNELKKISEQCGLKNCVKFLVELNKRIVADQVDKVCSKFNIKNKDPKNIWSGVLPLARVLFEAIESNFDVKESVNQKLQGLTMYCKLKNPRELRLDNLLFMLRLFSGRISENDEIVCKDRNGERTVKIDELYKFNVSNLKRIESCEAPGLLLVKANLAKHSLVYSVDNEDGENDDLCTISQKPFYKANISLPDSADTDRFKEALKTLSYLEPILKVKLNKYGEYEFFCEGKVQFEKICQDLSDNDFSFTICKQKMNFREMCGSEEVYKGDVNVSVKHSTEIPNNYTCIKGTSTLLCLSEKYADIAKCAFEYIVSHGPLVDEQIEFTHFTIDIDQSKNFDDPFNAIKKGLISAYIQTTPILIPLYFQCRIQAGLDYIGNVYKSLHKYSYTLKNEVYDSEMEFFEVFIYIPQFQYYDFVEDLRMKTKGTCYIEFEEYGYMINEKHKFTEHIEMIKKSKGMFTEDLAVADPEKQRTLKK